MNPEVTLEIAHKVCPATLWRGQRDGYVRKVGPFTERRRYRRSRGLKHPIEDFIWEYYGLRGSHLMKWHPVPGTVLEDADAEEFPEADGYRDAGAGRVLDVEEVCSRRASGIRWILNLLKTIDARSPVFSCLGLHEWAMVYEEKDIRHSQLPLRLSHEETRRVVETYPMRCTHFDAFRFFSESARPLNASVLTSETRTEHEQPGCLHANMDLFKWCMKLQPLVPSSLTLRCFEMACRAREVDMQASPYDLSEYGKVPIKIETASGRSEYVQAQQEIAREGGPLRRELIQVLSDLEDLLCKSDPQRSDR